MAFEDKSLQIITEKSNHMKSSGKIWRFGFIVTPFSKNIDINSVKFLENSRLIKALWPILKRNFTIAKASLLFKKWTNVKDEMHLSNGIVKFGVEFYKQVELLKTGIVARSSLF